MLKVQDGVAKFEDLSLPHGFSTMSLGNMAYSRGSEDEVNRSAESFYSRTGLDRENRVHMLPQHGTKIVLVSSEDAGQTVECDGLVTRIPGVTLSLCPADCLPIIIKSTDEHGLFVALIHAGWKGTRDGVVSKALLQLSLSSSLYSGEPFMAYIGPGIGACCYRPNLLSKMVGAKSDLTSENVRQLRRGGIKEENIIVANTCTYCAKDENGEYLLFSHQRAKRMGEREGRFIAAVAPKPLITA